MEVVERKENPLLERVEIRFSWRHVGSKTPSRRQLLAAVAAVEPGSAAEQIIVKDVSTRFGQPLTTGLAFVYNSAEALANEPEYILARQAAALGAKDTKPPESKAAPAQEAEQETAAASEEESPADEAPEAPAEVETKAEEVAGGEE